MKRLFIAMIIGLILVTGCQSLPEADKALAPEKAIYRLSANDIIRLRVFDEPDLSGKFVVDSTGMIAVPLLGKVKLAGLSEAEAIDYLGSALEKKAILRQPKIALEIMSARPVFVIGEVAQAGSFPFQPGMTVTQAVALAGGYTYRADRHDIVLKRQSNPQTLTQVTKYSATEDTPLLPGDTIEITERFF